MSYTVIEKARSGTDDLGGNRVYIYTFQVISTDTDDTINDIVTAVGIFFGDACPEDVTCFCHNGTATQNPQELTEWTVVITYSNEPLDQGQGTTDGSDPSGDPGQGANSAAPDARPPTVTFDSVETTELFVIDRDNTKVRASNTIPFDPPVEIPVYHLQITITLFKAVANDSSSNVLYYTGRVNSDTFFGCPAGTLLCKKYTLAGQWEQGAWYYAKTVVLEGKYTLRSDGEGYYGSGGTSYDGWNPIRILDCGTVTRESMSDPQFKPIKDAEGNPVTQPVPLNGSGGQLAPGADPVYKTFKGYTEVSFATIL